LEDRVIARDRVTSTKIIISTFEKISPLIALMTLICTDLK
jgi:hypothetical protein